MTLLGRHRRRVEPPLTRGLGSGFWGLFSGLHCWYGGSASVGPDPGGSRGCAPGAARSCTVDLSSSLSSRPHPWGSLPPRLPVRCPSDTSTSFFLEVWAWPLPLRVVRAGASATTTLEANSAPKPPGPSSDTDAEGSVARSLQVLRPFRSSSRVRFASILPRPSSEPAPGPAPGLLGQGAGVVTLVPLGPVQVEGLRHRSRRFDHFRLSRIR